MRGNIDARKNFQKRRLAGAVGADEADTVAVVDVEGDVVQRAHSDAIRGVARDVALP